MKCKIDIILSGNHDIQFDFFEIKYQNELNAIFMFQKLLFELNNFNSREELVLTENFNKLYDYNYIIKDGNNFISTKKILLYHSFTNEGKLIFNQKNVNGFLYYKYSDTYQELLFLPYFLNTFPFKKYYNNFSDYDLDFENINMF